VKAEADPAVAVDNSVLLNEVVRRRQVPEGKSKFRNGGFWADDFPESVAPDGPILSAVRVDAAYVVFRTDPSGVLKHAVLDEPIIGGNVGAGWVLADFEHLLIRVAQDAIPDHGCLGAMLADDLNEMPTAALDSNVVQREIAGVV